ncbi:MAG: hypothetical protein WCQ72_02450 [Eubacteriales bacterium]
MLKSKQICAAALLCAMLTGLAACGATPSNSPAATTAASTTSADTVTTEAELKPDLPALDLAGAEFKYLTKLEGDESGQWTAVDIYVEAQNGEVINDAVYARNQIIEEKYNCRITQGRMAMGGQYSYTMYKDISKLIMAGDNTYDVIMPTIQDAALLARDGMLYDLGSLENIDLTMPWWNQQFIADTAIGGKNYIGDGDICMTFMRAVYCILFNKQLIENYSLENPYDIVEAGGWTIDKILEMGAVFASDTNGDGIMDETDNNGLLLLDNQIEALYTASGNKFVTSDGGKFVFNGSSEQSINVLEKIYQLYEATDVVLCPSDAKRVSSAVKGTNHVLIASDAFAASHALFLLGTMNNVPRMRNMETDFGILPLPKSSETQSDYYSYVQTWASGSAAITITAKDVNASSIILEDMAYYAREYTTPSYYETALKTKYARDTESQLMLDVIYESRTCDLGNLFNVGSVVSGVTSLIFTKHKNTFASYFESRADKIAGELAEMDEML